MTNPANTNRNLSPALLAAYMHACIEMIPPEGPDSIQWQMIKDMTARTVLPDEVLAAPVRKSGCGGGCGGSHS